MSLASRLLTLALSVCLVAPLGAEPFVVEDTVVSDPRSSLSDLEFDQKGFRFTWQDKSRNLWVALVDAVTGDLIPRNGKGQWIDDNLVPMRISGNGPEWSYGAAGTRIVYSKLVGRTGFLGLAAFDGTVWQGGVLPGAEGRTPLASLDSDDPAPRVRYRSTAGDATVFWGELDDNAPPAAIPLASGGRWIGGERALSVNVTVGEVSQVARYDIDPGTFTQVSADAGTKYDPFIFRAPEFNNDWVAIADIDHQRIGVWREIAGTWTRINTLEAPTKQPLSLSAEPFIYRGRSYIFMVDADTNQHSDIWIATIDPTRPFYRQVSEPSLMVRQDPEFLVTAQGAYIYYTEKALDDTRIIHRCATGLGLPQSR
ncbi:hypothetical protein [Candidatus Cyanaurora vandensis]|uniref:hypothetical protein n=1 Tax=Candidatus Cyanaurora vandensis TaxID=2714958 RepID=UPI00257BC5EC|nr:hypothetical protein [Candidatus Cyanaurora vandensis]